MSRFRSPGVRERCFREHFDRNALARDDLRTADYSNAASYGLRQAVVSRWLSGLVGLRIADIGCGNGLLTTDLAKTNRVFGVDLALGMVRLAGGRGLLGAQARAAQLPLRGESCDVTLVVELAQYLPHLEDLITEIVRITHPGGRIIFSCLHRSLARRMWSTLKPAGPLNPYLHSPRSVQRILAAGGVRVIESCVWFQPLRVRSTSRLGRCLGQLAGSAFAVMGIRES
ncbi:MAG: class I SAM-dependent methyltransferase [Candidatus Eisenbacteria sp.]|nr:class I SAM-dependent methyltransferase [Candidatus Eisenbacteria bacterium]